MKLPIAGTPGPLLAPTAGAGHPTPTHYLRRVARFVVLRAALRGRLSWHVALPLLDHIGGGAQ